MSIYHLLRFFKASRSSVAAIVVALALTGCSSTMSNVKTWQGEAAESSETAVMEAPGEIQVQQVNGRDLGNFLMDDLALDYELLPGENQVVFTYKTIWAKSGVVRNGESKVHVVETAPQAVTLDAQPGETYQFSFQAPGSRNEAEAFANEFTADIVNASGEVVATAGAWDGSSSEPSRPVRTSVASEGGDTDSESSGEGSTLEQLKTLWGEADEEERRAFLRWAFE